MASTTLRVHAKTHSQIGKPVEIGGRQFLATALGERGTVLYGPYEEYAPGRYLAEFTLALQPGFSARNDNICCELDVVADFGKRSFGRLRVFTSDLGPEPQPFFISFDLMESEQLEFRVLARGHAPLLVGCERVVTSIDSKSGRFTPVLGPEAVDPPEFLVANFDMFWHRHAAGLRFSVEDGQIIAQSGGVRVLIDHVEQFQLLDEIFIHQEYGFVSGRPVCAFDIGMNAGFTSLQLASRPYVEEVHGYEPFQGPFERARANLSLNPHLAGRISLNNVGLSDFDGEQTIHVDEGDSIGTSVRGHNSGAEQKILIRDAGSALKTPIDSAVRRGLEVFIKIDCEGSEFAILDSLKRADLLRHVTAMAVEWHKWWDFEKTQEDLFASLLPAGFFIFDSTGTSNPDAGFFYAIRSYDRNVPPSLGRQRPESTGWLGRLSDHRLSHRRKRTSPSGQQAVV